MSEQHYAPPEADITASSGELGDLMIPLMATKPWVRFLSILGFIFCALMIFAGLGIFATGGNPALANALGSIEMTKIIGFVYLIFAVFYFFPSLYLFKYASAIASANLTTSIEAINTALNYQKSVWKFVGIMSLIMTIMFVGFIIMGIMMGVSGR